LPDVPTLVESGYKEMVLESWFGLFAPPKTPSEFIKALNGAMETALGDATLRENFAKGSLEPMGGPPEALATLAQSDSAKYARLVKELNISAGGG
jgi:tripartite-type tricarboxylate transporter receptor subunit TctC